MRQRLFIGVRVYTIFQAEKYQFDSEEIKRVMTENLIANQLKMHIIRQLACQKYKKNDLLKIYTQIFQNDTNARKQDIVSKLADKISDDALQFVGQLEKKSLSKTNLKQPLTDYLSQKLNQLNIGDVAATFNKRVDDILNCESGEEATFVFNHRQLRPTQQTICSVWNEVEDRFIECLCPKAPSNLEENKRKQACYKCGQLCHVECFWPREKDELFECPFCFLKNCLPNRAVKNIVFAGYLPILKKEKAEYKISFNLSQNVKMDKNIQVEARCVKFNSKNRFQISWPDNCAVWLGKYKVQEFKPLMTNSPLKRRFDEPIKLQKNKLNLDNELIIEEKNISDHTYRINKKCIHLVAIMLVNDLGKKELQNAYLKSFVPAQQGQQAVREYLEKGSQELKVERMSISLKCQYYGNKISYPIRSKHCSSHYQPFDLNNFIFSSLQAKNSTKKWKCPICDKRAYDIIVDGYVLDVMRKNSRAMEITFQSDGSPVARDDLSSQHEEEHELQLRKEKKDPKNSQLIDLQTPPVYQSQPLPEDEPPIPLHPVIQPQAIVLDDSSEKEFIEEEYNFIEQNLYIDPSQQIYESDVENSPKRPLSPEKQPSSSERIRKLRKCAEYEMSEQEGMNNEKEDRVIEIERQKEVEVIQLSSDEQMKKKETVKKKKNKKKKIGGEENKQVISSEWRKQTKGKEKKTILAKKISKKEQKKSLTIGEKKYEKNYENIIDIISSDEERRDIEEQNSTKRKQWKYEKTQTNPKNSTDGSLPKSPIQYIVEGSDGERFPLEQHSKIDQEKPFKAT